MKLRIMRALVLDTLIAKGYQHLSLYKKLEREWAVIVIPQGA